MDFVIKTYFDRSYLNFQFKIRKILTWQFKIKKKNSKWNVMRGNFIMMIIGARTNCKDYFSLTDTKFLLKFPLFLFIFWLKKFKNVQDFINTVFWPLHHPRIANKILSSPFCNLDTSNQMLNEFKWRWNFMTGILSKPIEKANHLPLTNQSPWIPMEWENFLQIAPWK